jgi:hypothetical protein
MADNYLEFSEVIPQLTAAEESWLREQLQPICLYGDREYPADEDGYPVGNPEEVADKDPDWVISRFLREHVSELDDNGAGFGTEFDDDTDSRPGNWGRHLWVFAEEFGDPYKVAWLVQKFLKTFRPDQCWSLTYATTCSKPRVGEFGGGAMFVTANEVRWQNAYEFVEQQRAAFKQNRKPHQGKTDHGKTTASKP